MTSSIIGTMRVTLGADTAQFTQGMEEARRKLGGMKSPIDQFKAGVASIAAPAAVAAGAVAVFTTGMQLATAALQNADALSAAATKIGVTAEALQALRFAGEDADIPIDALDSGLSSLNATLGALKSGIGDGKIRKAFEALGIPDSQLATMRDASDLLPILAEKIKGVGSQAEQVQIAKKLGVEDLLPLLQRGAVGIQGLTDEARALGLVMGDDVVTQLADMSRELEIAEARSAMAGRALGAALSPALIWAKEKTAELVTELSNLLERFKDIDDRSTTALQHNRDQAYWKMSKLMQGNQTGDPANADPAKLDWFARAQYDKAKKAYDDANRELARRQAAALKAPSATGYTGKTPNGGELGSSRSARSGASAASLQEPDLLDLARQHRADLEARAAETARWFSGEVLDPATLQEPIAEGVAAGYAEGLARTRDEIREGYRNAIQGGLYAAIYGGGKGLMGYLADEFKRSLVGGLADKLSNVLTGSAMGGGNSKGGAFLNFLGSVFGAGKNANGTANWRGGMTWVGERGPELVSLPGGSRITPNHALGGAMGGGVLEVRISAGPTFKAEVAETAAGVVGAAAGPTAELGSRSAQAAVATQGRYRIAR